MTTPYYADRLAPQEGPTMTEPAAIGSTQPTTERVTLGYYRHPSMDGRQPCHECGHLMQEHGWLDTGGDGIAVCPSGLGPFGGQTITERGRAATPADSECAECERLRGVVHTQGVAIDGYREAAVRHAAPAWRDALEWAAQNIHVNNGQTTNARRWLQAAAGSVSGIGGAR